MARARNIKPSIMDNEQLADLEPLTRLLFVYLWMLANRDGRLEDRPKRIAAQALPFDRAADIDEMLQALEDGGFIERYVAKGIAVIQVANFCKHQTPHGTEKDGLMPDRSGCITVNERGKNGYITGKSAQVEVGLTVNQLSDNTLIPDSPIPDSGFTDSLNTAADAATPSRKTKIPKSFAVSEAVRRWAKGKGYERLDEHMEAFKAKCAAKGYRYADWDAAFMEAVRADWANLRGRGPNGSAPAAESTTTPMRPDALMVAEPPLTPEQLAANKERAMQVRELLAQAAKRMTA